ncbi:MAG: hypothetical protein DSM106950_42520 [Stigonema ocellatum SAG 48.90 = DSM 106950]|nr:hypothetical protein [Stigonema ocellatum SAG 48.90 = DSM 106950]
MGSGEWGNRVIGGKKYYILPTSPLPIAPYNALGYPSSPLPTPHSLFPTP